MALATRSDRGSVPASSARAPSTDCGPLPASGNPYRVEVIDWQNDATGPYTIHLYRLTATAACEDVALSCDVPQAGSIESPVDKDFFSFSAAEGEWVEVSLVELAEGAQASSPRGDW